MVKFKAQARPGWVTYTHKGAASLAPVHRCDCPGGDWPGLAWPACSFNFSMCVASLFPPTYAYFCFSTFPPLHITLRLRPYASHEPSRSAHPTLSSETTRKHAS